AIVRAVNHLKKRNKRNQVSLIVSGGMQIPGHFLKMLALGADAIYIGSAMLFAVSHSQSLNAIPFEPPTQVAWNQGKFKDQFNIEEGAKTAENFLTSSVEEMKMALRGMGKRSLNELSKKDLVSYDAHIAKMVEIPYSFKAWKEEQQQTEKG
ncbi:glutamate synthase-related protein, partial [Oceanobacillus caeni]